MILNREGRVYVINYKPVREYLNLVAEEKRYDVGLMKIFPNGFKESMINDISLECSDTPILNDQLYYIKWIDSDHNEGEKGYHLKFSRKEGDNIYYDAEVTTNGFKLIAPKIELKDSEARVKINILSKIKIS